MRVLENGVGPVHRPAVAYAVARLCEDTGRWDEALAHYRLTLAYRMANVRHHRLTATVDVQRCVRALRTTAQALDGWRDARGVYPDSLDEIGSHAVCPDSGRSYVYRVGERGARFLLACRSRTHGGRPSVRPRCDSTLGELGAAAPDDPEPAAGMSCRRAIAHFLFRSLRYTATDVVQNIWDSDPRACAGLTHEYVEDLIDRASSFVSRGELTRGSLTALRLRLESSIRA